MFFMFFIRKSMFLSSMLFSMITAILNYNCPLIMLAAYVVCRGRHKPLIGQHDIETTVGQTQPGYIYIEG